MMIAIAIVTFATCIAFAPPALALALNRERHVEARSTNATGSFPPTYNTHGRLSSITDTEIEWEAGGGNITRLRAG